MIFCKARWFYGKKNSHFEGNLIPVNNWKSIAHEQNVLCDSQLHMQLHLYDVTFCAKGFLDSNFNSAVFDQYFTKLPKIWHAHKIAIFTIFGKRNINLLNLFCPNDFVAETYLVFQKTCF